MEVLQLFTSALLEGIDIPSPENEPTTSPDSMEAAGFRPRPFGSGDGWTGPDALGWYTRTTHTGYGNEYLFTEKFRRLPDENATEYETSLTYSDAEGSFSYETKSRTAVDEEGLMDGYYDMITECSGYNSISDAEFKFEYADYDQDTGAGIFDWYWGGGALGSDYTALHRYLNIIATPTTPEGWLHLHVTYYEGMGGNWEYDTPFSATGE